MADRIESASYSRIQIYESCKYHAFLKFAKKIPEPDRPLPPGRTEHANDRGTRIHSLAENFILGKIPDMPKDLMSFEEEFEHLHKLHKFNKNVHLEEEWGLDKNWEPTEWERAWIRLKLDAFVLVSETEGIAIDFKTGKKFGNEIKHAEQMQLYQLCAFMRYPLLEKVTTELWYLDVKDISSKTYNRQQGLGFRRRFDRRFSDMTNATEFPANPNVHSCKWCPYGTKKDYSTGHCQKEIA